jgi:hypothetical protein
VRPARQNSQFGAALAAMPTSHDWRHKAGLRAELIFLTGNGL